MVLPPASFTVGTSVTVSPTDVRVFVLGDTVTVEAVWLTVTVAIALTEPDWARTVALPTDIAVTSPFANTVATAVFDEDHVTVAPDIVLPPASFTVAVSCCVPPIDEKLKLVCDSVIDAEVWVTETDAVPLTEPDVAVIVAVPSATEVTSPADETVATEVLDEDHVTVAPDMVLPPASFTVATSVAVSESEAKLKLVGDSASEDAL